MIANAIVNPKLFMKRPTMPPMKPTGTKIATSDNVVASTARPISWVASTAAWNWSSCRSEALHEASDDAAHEADRHEDRDQRQRRRQYGEADLLGRVDRRLELVLVQIGSSS